MNIFLLRHFESEKNIADTLSSRDDDESLTFHGRQACAAFSTHYKSFCVKNNIVLHRVHCADSMRASETAQTIAETMNTPIVRHAAFRSTSPGNLMGKSMKELKTLAPFFYHNFYLYKKGLLNLYYFDDNWIAAEKETRKDFERRVVADFTEITNRREDTLIVSHRASITAILLHVARLMGIYSHDFYGCITLGVGKISWLQYKDHAWTIKCLDEDVREMDHA